MGESVMTQPWRLGFGYMQRALNGAARSIVEPPGAGRVLRDLLKGYTQFLFETASVGVFAAETALETLDRPASDRVGGSMMGSAPRTWGTSVEVDGKPMLLPVRIGDASQAWALYCASEHVATRLLRDRASLFRTFTLADGRAPVAIMCTDFRACDLGTYHEVALVAFVTPRSEPASPPGMFFLSLVVSEEFTRDAALQLWNFDKIYAPHLQVGYSGECVDFVGPGSRQDNFRISFPRVRGLRSTAVPVYLYSSPHQNAVARRTILTRNGVDEGLQIGGNVRLELHEDKTRCPCGNPAQANLDNCFCRQARDLGLEHAPVIANGWTEHMSGAFGPARACRSPA
jgi:hypothetical protein